MLEWTGDEPSPDVINLPNSLLISMAAPLREATGRPVCCTLQGEDLFLNGLLPSYRTEALDADSPPGADVDRFIGRSASYYADFMSRLLAFRATDRRRAARDQPRRATSQRERPATGSTVGYFARVAPEKGLHELATPTWRSDAGRAGRRAARGGRLPGAVAVGVSRGRRARSSRGPATPTSSPIAACRRSRAEARVPARAGRAVGADHLRRAEGHVPARGDGERRPRRAAAARRVPRDGREDRRRRPRETRRCGEPRRRAATRCGATAIARRCSAGRHSTACAAALQHQPIGARLARGLPRHVRTAPSVGCVIRNLRCS